MSKLDDIQFFYKGEAISLRHKPQAKQQIKDLFLKLVRETADNSGDELDMANQLIKKVGEL